MKRFSIRAIFLLIAVIGVCFWLFDSGYRTILREPFSDRNLLTMRARPIAGEDQYQIRITYHYPPGFLYVASEFTAQKPEGGWQFGTVRDSQDGLVCVYDKNDLHWIWMYNATDDDIWESSPNRNSSLHATDRIVWQSRFEQLRQEHLEIPYTELPK